MNHSITASLCKGNKISNSNFKKIFLLFGKEIRISNFCNNIRNSELGEPFRIKTGTTGLSVSFKRVPVILNDQSILP